MNLKSLGIDVVVRYWEVPLVEKFDAEYLVAARNASKDNLREVLGAGPCNFRDRQRESTR